MKKIVILTLIMMIAYSNIKAQFKMSTDGNCAIATTPAPVSNIKLQVLTTTAIENLWVYSNYSSITNMRTYSQGSYCIGAHGYSAFSTALGRGQAYGVYGVAGNATSGYNYGVYGLLGGSVNGAGVFGASRGNSVMDVAGNWAGFFNGSVDVEGGLYLYRVWYVSDQRLKKNILTVPNTTIDKISQLNAVQFQYKTKKEMIADGIITVSDTSKAEEPDDENINKIQYGYIAQDVQKIFPELVCEKANGILGVNYNGMIPLMLEAIKQQENKITQLQSDLSNCCKTTEKSIQKSANQNSADVNINNAVLYQNTPNPFSQQTQIKCFIPDNAMVSEIYIYDMQGSQIKKIQINGKGDETITIQGAELKAGMFMYTLIIDGKEIDTKKMILTD